jgi:hypothetical protein
MLGTRASSRDDVEPCSTGRGRDAFGDDPATRLFRAPLARVVAPLLAQSRVGMGLTLVAQPVLAAAAGYAVAFPDRRHMLWGALLFELRSTLGVMGRAADTARGRVASPREAHETTVGNALAATLFYAGIFWHFRLFAPPAGAWSRYVSEGGVVFLAVVFAAARALVAERWSARRVVDAEPSQDGVARLVSLAMRASGGGAFLTLVTLAMFTDHLWESQLFFAAAGGPWLMLVALLGSARSAQESALGERAVDRAEP